MPGTLTVDTGATFQAVLLMASGPKLKFGSTEQDISARGERKWDVQAAVTYHAEPGMKPVSEVIAVTVTGPGSDPCAAIPPGTPSADLLEWSAIPAQAGIPHAGTHTMRQSAATIALEEGVALAVVQEMLGHSDIRVTRGYTHVSSVLAQDGAARLDRALFGETATKTATKSHDP